MDSFRYCACELKLRLGSGLGACEFYVIVWFERFGMQGRGGEGTKIWLGMRGEMVTERLLVTMWGGGEMLTERLLVTTWGGGVLLLLLTTTTTTDAATRRERRCCQTSRSTGIVRLYFGFAGGVRKLECLPIAA